MHTCIIRLLYDRLAPALRRSVCLTHLFNFWIAPVFLCLSFITMVERVKQDQQYKRIRLLTVVNGVCWLAVRLTNYSLCSCCPCTHSVVAALVNDLVFELRWEVAPLCDVPQSQNYHHTMPLLIHNHLEWRWVWLLVLCHTLNKFVRHEIFLPSLAVLSLA